MYQDESNKISHEYILPLIYASKIKFKFLSYKMKKFKVDKQKEIEKVLDTSILLFYRKIHFLVQNEVP